MTPKEKALELVDNFEKFSAYGLQKQCALIAVDEILSFIEDDRKFFSWKKYYQEVKQEIKLL